MKVGIDTKLKSMLWDMPEIRRSDVSNEIITNAVNVFRRDEQLFIKALNSLKWYELTKLIGKENLFLLLTDSTIQKLYPQQRRTYYTNARRLLSKYVIPASKQSA